MSRRNPVLFRVLTDPDAAYRRPCLPTPQQRGECIDRGARIGVRVEPAPSLGADAAPLPHQQSAAEQIGPNRHAIVSPLVQLRPDAHERRGFREQRELNRRRRGRGMVAAFGHDVATTVTPAARRGHRNRPSVGANRAAFVTSHPVLTAMAKDPAGQGRRPRPRKPQTRFADMRGRLAARWFARPRPVPCSADKRNYWQSRAGVCLPRLCKALP